MRMSPCSWGDIVPWPLRGDRIIGLRHGFSARCWSRGVNVILREMDELTPAVGVEKQGFIHISIPVGMLQCNCSIIGDPVTREALVVDPGDEVSRILDLLGRHKLTVKAIVSTHAHIDHVGGLSK